MPSRIKLLFAIAFLLVCRTGAMAQENDYLKHNKIFYYCSFKQNCDGCYTCENNRYEIKIRNNQDKQIKSIRYQYYSALYKKVETREAKIEGDVINSLGTGILYVCVPNIRRWAISEITYTDGSVTPFVVYGGVQHFDQEPDECDCN